MMNTMEPVDVLASLRPLVITVDALGVVREVFGGYGGFLGLDTSALVGASVFDFLPPADGAELAQYLLESAAESFETVSLPLPFRVGVIGGGDEIHAVDVIVAGQDAGDGTWNWVATLVPASLEATVSRPLDALVEREPRDRVKALLADELTVDNTVYSSRGFLVDLSGEDPVTIGSREDVAAVATAIDRAVGEGWAPWNAAAHAETVPVDLDDLPGEVRRAAAARGWRRCSVTSVWLEGAVVAAYVVMGKVPGSYPVGEVRANIAARYRQLARMTSLIMGAWRDRDRLEWAATHDALTAVANRRAFDAALSTAPPSSALLFIDVDDFKSVNDRFGHAIGDDVLVEVARRIASTCDERDLVARIGGDEFVVLLTAPGPGRIASTVDAVTDAMRRPWPATDGPDAVRVTVGIVDEIGTDGALARASRAMLGRKRRDAWTHRGVDCV